MTLYKLGSHRVNEINQVLIQNYLTGLNKMANNSSDDIDAKEKAYVDIKKKRKSTEKQYAYTGEALGALSGGLAGAGLAKWDGGVSKGFGAIAGGLMGGIMGNQGGKRLFENTNQPLHDEYRKRSMDLDNSVPPLPDLNKQAAYDARAKELEEQYEQAEDNLMHVHNQVPESIREQQRKEENKHALIGSAAGGLAGAGIGGLLGQAKGVVPFLKPSPAGGAIAGGLTGAFTGALLGTGKGYSNGQKILQDYDPNLPNQMREAGRKYDEAENAYFEHTYGL